MKARPRSLSAPVSRRTLLHGVAGTAGAAMILGATPNSASAVVKLSQKVVAYQDHPDGDKRRGKCVHIGPPRRRALHANPRHADRSVARIDRCNRHHRPQRPQRSLTRSRGRCDSPSCVPASILAQCPCRTATLARSSRTGRQPIKHYSSNAIDRR